MVAHATTSSLKEIFPLKGSVCPKKRPQVSTLDGIVENSRVKTPSNDATGALPLFQISDAGCETMIFRGKTNAIMITAILNQNVECSVNQPLEVEKLVLTRRQIS